MFDFNSSVRHLITIVSLFFCSIFFIYCSSPQSDSEQTADQKGGITKAKEDVPELADAMGQLQYYLHKYALAVEAQNHELASFYFHEVRAAADGIQENIPGYEGYDIARFMKMFLQPTLPPIETALANKRWEEVRTKTIEMVDACNSCHNATSHGFVEIKAGFNNNPYNQDFSAPE